MADTYLAPRVPLEDGETELLGDKLNSELDAHMNGINLSWKERGAWDETKFVKQNDVYTYQGKRWLALAATNGVTPVAGASWALVGSNETGGGHTIENPAGDDLAQRDNLQFSGDGVTVTDDAPGNRTKVTITQQIDVYLANILKGTRGKVNFIEGDNVSVSAVDNPGTGAVDVTIGATTTVWRSGTGAPSNTLGNNSDFYTNNTNSDIYKKIGGVWVFQQNIKGAPGNPGAPGAAGNTIREGAGDPDNATGNNGDFWVNTTTWNVFVREAGVYVLKGNIKAKVENKTSAQRDALTPAEGDLIYNTDTKRLEFWNGIGWIGVGLQPRESEIEVPSTEAWTSTAIPLDSLDSLTVEASGTVNYGPSSTSGPDGLGTPLINGFPRYSLVGVVMPEGDTPSGNQSGSFLVGAAKGVVGQEGVLWLRFNDSAYNDNSGAFDVVLKHYQALPEVAGSITSADISDFGEAVQDTVGAMVTDTSSIDATYNDAGGLETLDLKATTVVPGSYTNADITVGADGRITAASDGSGGGGAGNVVGPATATDNALARYDGTTGALLQNSGVVLGDDNALILPEITTPSNPASGKVALYGKGGSIYARGSSGTEVDLGGSGGGATLATAPAIATNIFAGGTASATSATDGAAQLAIDGSTSGAGWFTGGNGVQSITVDRGSGKADVAVDTFRLYQSGSNGSLNQGLLETSADNATWTSLGTIDNSGYPGAGVWTNFTVSGTAKRYIRLTVQTHFGAATGNITEMQLISVASAGNAGTVTAADKANLNSIDFSGGGRLYTENGALKFQGANGTITTLAVS